MQVDEGICAGCGKALGPRAFWHVPPGGDGRAYHLDCPVSEREPEPPLLPPPPPAPAPPRKGRNWQPTLEQDELAKRRGKKGK